MSYRTAWWSIVLGMAACLLGARVAPAQHDVAGEEEEFPRVQFPDSLFSLNDRCIVRLRKLSLRLPATTGVAHVRQKCRVSAVASTTAWTT